MSDQTNDQAAYSLPNADTLMREVEKAVDALRQAAAVPPVLSLSGVSARPASAALHRGMQEVQTLLGLLQSMRLTAVEEIDRFDRTCESLARDEENIHGIDARRSYVAAHERAEQIRNEHIVTKAQLERAIQGASAALREAASAGLPGSFAPREMPVTARPHFDPGLGAPPDRHRGMEFENLLALECDRRAGLPQMASW